MKARVHFELMGEPAVGDLYLPASDGPHPAVVVVGPMTSVKEQVTGVYASALATRGLAALAFDPRHFGESGGQPRQYEHHEAKTLDTVLALEWLATCPQVDAERLGLAGVCLGCGYAAHAAAGNDRVRSLGFVAGYYRDPELIRAADRDGFDAKVEQGIRERERYERTGEVTLIPAAALEGDAAMTLPDTFDYYATPRAGVPNYRNAFAVMSREHFLGFDVQSAAAHLDQPLLMVHAERALSPARARAFYERIRGEKRIAWLDAPCQVDFYDQVDLVTRSADLLADHFHASL